MPRSRSQSPKRRKRSSSRSPSVEKANDGEGDRSSASESSSHAKKPKKKKHKDHKEHKKHKKHSTDGKSKKHKKHSKEEEALKFLQAAKSAEVKVDNPLTAEDYFRKATEFRVWLQRQDRYLEQFSAEKARSKFNKFIQEWNAGTLTPDFYKGMDRTAVTEKLSKHKWKFKNVTSEEAAKRETTRDTVDTFTKAKGGENLDQLGPIAFRLAAQAKAVGPSAPVGPAGPPERPRQPVGPNLHEAGKPNDDNAGPQQTKKPFVDKRMEEQISRGNDARAKEDARMAAFKASMAPFLNFEKK